MVLALHMDLERDPRSAGATREEWNQPEPGDYLQCRLVRMLTLSCKCGESEMSDPLPDTHCQKCKDRFVRRGERMEIVLIFKPERQRELSLDQEYRGLTSDIAYRMRQIELAEEAITLIARDIDDLKRDKNAEANRKVATEKLRVAQGKLKSHQSLLDEYRKRADKVSAELDKLRSRKQEWSYPADLPDMKIELAKPVRQTHVHGTI